MSDTIIEAYKKLHDGQEPLADTEEWVLASEVLDNWDVSKLGEELAKETLFKIRKNTPFPTVPISNSVEIRVREKLMELYPHSFEEGDDIESVIKQLEEAFWKEKAERERTGEKLNLK